MWGRLPLNWGKVLIAAKMLSLNEEYIHHNFNYRKKNEDCKSNLIVAKLKKNWWQKNKQSIGLLLPTFLYSSCLTAPCPFIANLSPFSGSNGKRQPIRVFLSNESGYYLDMCVYKEVTNHVTGQTVFHAYGTKQGPWHGNWSWNRVVWCISFNDFICWIISIPFQLYII